jgi:hypothetical protein
MDLKKNEILQINLAIMVGVLILLTLGSNLTHIRKIKAKAVSGRYNGDDGRVCIYE